MSGRPWLEALKGAMKEKVPDADVSPQEALETLLPQGCKRCESPVDEPPLIVDIQTACVPRGEDERRLQTLGWKPKERCGKTIWKCPDNGFYYSQEMAPYFLDRSISNVRCKSGAYERR
jgi:hypothetical protein